MGLPAVKPNIGLKSNSISVQFLIFKNGWIAALTSTEPNAPGQGAYRMKSKKMPEFGGLPCCREARRYTY